LNREKVTKLLPAGRIRPARSVYTACRCTVEQMNQDTVICTSWCTHLSLNDMLQKSWNKCIIQWS